jgi:hypothetical protein
MVREALICGGIAPAWGSKTDHFASTMRGGRLVWRPLAFPSLEPRFARCASIHAASQYPSRHGSGLARFENEPLATETVLGQKATSPGDGTNSAFPQ